MNINDLKAKIANNKTKDVLDVLLQSTDIDSDTINQISLLSAKWNDAKKKSNLGLITNTEAGQQFAQVNYALLELMGTIELADMPDTSNAASTLQATPQPDKNTVFISYNHNDKEIAHALKEKLRAKGIDVTIDSEKMSAGTDIKEFIENCIRTTATTISLVSKRSLLSAWVAMESVNTFAHERTNANKKFIACYIDNDFFNRNFTDDALDSIDTEIAEIRALITKRMERGRNIRDLQNELTRYTDLQNNIDEIIRRLRESLCIDVKGDNLDKNFDGILNAITA